MKNLTMALLAASGLALATGCKKEVAPPPTDSFGVAECDAYFEAIDRCIASNPQMKASMEPSRIQNRDAWKRAAATPKGLESVKAICKVEAVKIAQSCR